MIPLAQGASLKADRTVLTAGTSRRSCYCLVNLQQFLVKNTPWQSKVPGLSGFISIAFVKSENAFSGFASKIYIMPRCEYKRRCDGLISIARLMSAIPRLILLGCKYLCPALISLPEIRGNLYQAGCNLRWLPCNIPHFSK